MARKEFASSLLNLLQRKLEFDKWEQVNTKPELFTRGGQIYDQVVKKLGPLKDDMHLTIPGIPGKVSRRNNTAKYNVHICSHIYVILTIEGFSVITIKKT